MCTEAAEAGVKGMKGKKVFMCEISVEYSLPGGFLKCQEQPPGPKLSTTERVPRTHTPFAISY
jgi:hypothetical protein